MNLYRRTSSLFYLLTAALPFTSAQSPLSSQAGNATLQITLTDATHAPIEDAKVNIVANGRPVSPPLTSDQHGVFTFSGLPGKYIVTVSKEHFTSVSKDIDLPTAGLELELIMPVAPLSSTVTVTESGDYLTGSSSSATKTPAPLQDIPQSITVISREQIKDQLMMSIADLVNYVPGVTAIQGENNRDQIVIRGNSTSADFFLDGVRDDVQFFRDLYNVDRVEVLKGPNALIFGRGGAGGVVNRVIKEANEAPLHEITLSGGSWGDKRFAADFDQPINSKLSVRLNGMYENAGTFRDYVNLERYGVNPAITITPSQRTRITLSYENFSDNRGSDRGIPSFQGKPIETGAATFFGNPDDNKVRALVNIGTMAIEHQAGRAHLTNRTSIADYDRGYQNFVPGAVTADGQQDSLSAYNNATQRRNIFNQTDLTYSMRTGSIRHTLLAGVEAGRQLTNNFRNTGYFNNTGATLLVPVSNPVIHTPVTFRQSATDADNHLKTNLGAVYAQDQIELSKHIQLVAGLRFDYFDLQYHDNRAGADLRRIDHLISPRAGIIFKPIDPLSLYASYSISWLPSSGDQFSSLTAITQQVKPEKFSNYEVGAKWDFTHRFALTSALYRLDRTNTRTTDPNDPARIVQTGSQRTNGFELGVNGNLTRAWSIAGGYAYQDAFVTSATASARKGAQVAQVPHNAFSLWNRYAVSSRLGAGFGLLNRTDMFAAIDNTVTLPGYFRADAAVYYSLTERVRLQVNVQNLFDTKYYINADNNTNISPGSPRSFVAALTTRF
jgi:catecholate siderophore receptor